MDRYLASLRQRFLSENMRKQLANEDGFSLTELIIAMIVIGILLAVGIGAYLMTQRSAENTQNRDKIATTYKTVANCKTENDGFLGSFDDIKGEYCLNSTTVNNNIQMCKIKAGGANINADDAFICKNAAGSADTRAGTCWNENAVLTAANKAAAATAAAGLAPAPKYASGDRQFNVGLCTFSAEASGVATGVNSTDSQFIRISAVRNKKIYYFVEDEGGFASCSAKESEVVADAGIPVTGLRCQA